MGSGEGVPCVRPLDGTRRPAWSEIETEPHGPARKGGGCKEMTQCAIRCVDARATLRGVGLDVCGGVGARGVEPGVRPGGGPRQRQLQDGSEEPGHARPARTPGGATHAGARISFRTTIAPTSTIPYIQTISGPVGRSPASESQRPRTEASAPEPHEM